MPLRPIIHHFTITGFYSAFEFSWDKNFRFHGERHDLWEIVLVTSGVVEATEDEKVYTLENNNMLLHAPMEFHRIASADGTSPSGIILSFSSTGVLPEELKNGVFVLSEADKQRYESIAKKIIRFLQEGDVSYSGQEVADLLSSFLIRLSTETAELRLDCSQSATEYRRIVSAMSRGVFENMTLSDFAKECSVSVSYIKQLFKKHAGISPKSYYTHLRVRQASQLLDEGLSATEIADKMNFSSPNYFSAFFKKNAGILPSEFKKTTDLSKNPLT